MFVDLSGLAGSNNRIRCNSVFFGKSLVSAFRRYVPILGTYLFGALRFANGFLLLVVVPPEQDLLPVRWASREREDGGGLNWTSPQ
jgi:hypothetical protein